MRAGRQLLYASAVGAIGLGVRSAVVGPVPPSVAVVAGLAFTGVVLAGVFEPRLGMFADVVCEGDPTEGAPRVALTFDDGPAERTGEVLDALDAAGAKATFFVIGRKIARAGGRERVRDAVARGHEVACHSFGHDRLFSLRREKTVRDDLRRALAEIEDATAVPTRLFRPPIGHTNPTIARVARELGLTLVGFSVRGYDGTRGATTERVERRVVDGLRDGAIVLLHDGAERDDFVPCAPAALPAILGGMRARGLSGVTVGTLLGASAVG